MMRSWNSKGGRAPYAPKNPPRPNHYISITNIQMALQEKFADWCAHTITLGSSVDLSLTKKLNGLPTIYETPLLSKLLDAKLLQPGEHDVNASPGKVHVANPYWWPYETPIKAKLGSIYFAGDVVDELYWKDTSDEKLQSIQQTINEMYEKIGCMNPKYGVSPKSNPISPPTNEEKLRAADALEKAADLLLFKGWHQGSAFKYSEETYK